MKLVSSTNSVVSEKVFLAGSWSFMYVTKSKGTEINPWETHVLLFPNLRKHFEFHCIILLCVFVLRLLGRILTSFMCSFNVQCSKMQFN
jgi:hypothetical protein